MPMGRLWYITEFTIYRCGGLGRLGGVVAPDDDGRTWLTGLFFGGVTRLLEKSSFLPEFACFFGFLASASLISRASALAACAFLPSESAEP